MRLAVSVLLASGLIVAATGADADSVLADRLSQPNATVAVHFPVASEWAGRRIP